LTSNRFQRAIEKARAGERLDREDGLALISTDDLATLAAAADEVCQRRHPESWRTYNIDRNINYTNVCTTRCRFCAFSCDPGDEPGYVISDDEIYAKIEETIELGGDQILLQGGMNPELDLAWYERFLAGIKSRFPQINIHGLSPPEIDDIARRESLSIDDVLVRLRDAGLGSLPGGGAEILVDRVREIVSPKKTMTDRWLEVCRRWHGMGGRGSATMMFGHVETLAERIEHFDRLRELQDETGGFTAFISWTFQPGRTDLADIPKAGTWDYLKTLAAARLYLDNFDNIQVSWVTQGLEIGELALRFGANDMGSLMIEENVVAAAGTSFRASEEAIRDAIRRSGFEPRRRDVFYDVVGSGQ